MKKQHFANVVLNGLNLTSFGFKIPSPFASLELNNSEVASATSFTLKCVVGGDASKQINVAAFEALLYSAAQNVSNNSDSSGIPISFVFGWLDNKGNISEYLSYEGFSVKFNVTTNGQYMTYEITGLAQLTVQSSIPALRIPELSGIVQPSAVVEGIAKATKATTYYELDIDHNDAPTLVSHQAMTTSFNTYIRGKYTGNDDYDTFPGLLRLSKSYNSSRDAAGLSRSVRKLSQVMNNISVSSVGDYLSMSIVDKTPQCSSFTYWVEAPTTTRPGIIHYKSNASLSTSNVSDTLEFGTSNTNILSLSGSYNGVAYNMTNMNFSQVGFALDSSGNAIAQGSQVVNSWSSSLADVFQSVNIINDVAAIASQFTGDFTVVIPGSVKKYDVAQPVSLIIMTGNTLSPVSGIYNIMSVSHSISNVYTTTLKLQRLVVSSANQVASGQGILTSGTSNYTSSSYTQTDNIISTGKVDFGVIYPTFEDLMISL